MLASLDALAKQELADGFAPFESETLRGGQSPQRLSIKVAGAKEMFLFVNGIPDMKWAVADWADARIIRDDGSGQLGARPIFQALLRQIAPPQ